MATVRFANPDDDPAIEIEQRGSDISCGDECFCREGPVLDEFRNVFDWSEDEGRFVQVE